MYQHRRLKYQPWLAPGTYTALLRRCNDDPRCVSIDPLTGQICGSAADLEIDHIEPRARGGRDDLDNLQILCRTHNRKKGTKPDAYWSRAFYYDQPLNIEALRQFQRIAVVQPLDDYAEWFARPVSQINRKLYTIAAVVGAGKGLVPIVAPCTLNRIVLGAHGPGRRRYGRVLVLAKEQSIRDELARACVEDVTKYGILPTQPACAVVYDGRWWQTGDVHRVDLAVSCIQQLFDDLYDVGAGHEIALASRLADFDLIAIDEPHYAQEQVLKIVDAAETSLCIGTTATPIETDGEVLKRYVLFSVYDYNSAVKLDQSMKHVGGRPPRGGRPGDALWNSIVSIVKVDECDLLREGEIDLGRSASDVKNYPIQQVAMESVAYSVIEEVKLLDELPPTQEVLAKHRQDSLLGTPTPTLRYPVHAMIRVAHINEARDLETRMNTFFAAHRDRFPETRGYFAERVHSDPGIGEAGDAVRGRGQTLPRPPRLTTKPMHPWLGSYHSGGKIEPRTARFLIVVGQGREGLNNPYCSVIGWARTVGSQRDALQDIGRLIRSVDRRTLGRLSEVPPRRLDTVRIITHQVYHNEGVIADAFDYMENMEDILAETMPSLDHIIGGTDPETEITPVDSPPLTIEERIDIASIIGGRLRGGAQIDDIDIDELVEQFGGPSERKQAKVEEWGRQVLYEPAVAGDRLGCSRDLEAEDVVLRDVADTPLTRERLVEYLEGPGVELIEAVGRLDDPLVEKMVRVMCNAHRQQYRRPVPEKLTTLSQLRRDLGAHVKRVLGTAYEAPLSAQGKPDDGPIYGTVGRAMRIVLGVPDGETLHDDSKYDDPTCHHILQNPRIKLRITQYAIGKLMRSDCCPDLAWAIYREEIEDEMAEQERAEDLWHAPLI